MANETTYADVKTLIGNIYELALMTAMEGNIIAPLVRHFTPHNDSIPRTWATYSGGTFANVAETDDLSAQTFTPSVAGTATPSVFAQQVFLTDKRIRSDPMTVQADTGEYLGSLASEDMDKTLAALFSSFTGGTVGTAGSTLTWADVMLASARLRKRSVPGPYFGVFDPLQWAYMNSATSGVPTLLQNNTRFMDSVVAQFYQGSYAGVDYFVDPNLTAGTATVAGMFGRDAIYVDMVQPFQIRPQYDASRSGQGGWELNASLEYANGIFRPTYGVKMIGAAQ
jgi:hypothetical protein